MQDFATEIYHDACPTAETLLDEAADLIGVALKEAAHRIREPRPDRRQRRLRHRRQVVRDHAPPGQAALQQRRRLRIDQRQITPDRGNILISRQHVDREARNVHRRARNRMPGRGTRRPCEPAGNLGAEHQPVRQMLPHLRPGRPAPPPAIPNPAQEHKQTLDRNPHGVIHVEIGRPIRDHLADRDVICIAGVPVCVVCVVSSGYLAREQRFQRGTT